MNYLSGLYLHSLEFQFLKTRRLPACFTLLSVCLHVRAFISFAQSKKEIAIYLSRFVSFDPSNLASEELCNTA